MKGVSLFSQSDIVGKLLGVYHVVLTLIVL